MLSLLCLDAIGRGTIICGSLKPQHPDDYNVTLVEHHKLRSKADCIGLYSTKFKRTTVRPRQSHMDCESAIKSQSRPRKTNPCNSKKRRRHVLTDSKSDSDWSETGEEFVPEKTDIRYDIYYPMASTSHVTYNSKLMIDKNVTHAEGRNLFLQ